MFDLVQILISLVAFLVAIALLVAIHELGHFWVARLLGVKVLKFSIGFGKVLFARRDKYGTEYVIAAIPLGGFVKMLDEREGEVPTALLPYAFNKKPVLSRFLIVLAGPIFNFLFAIIIYWLVFMIGITALVPKVGEVIPNSIAAKAGMHAFEEIIKVDNQPTSSWQAVSKQLMGRLGDKGILEIETSQQGATVDNPNTLTYRLDLSAWQVKGNKPDLIHSLGIVALRPPVPAVVYDVYSDEPAALAGVKAGDVILAVNQQAISTWAEFTKVISNSIDKMVTVKLQRDYETIEVKFRPRAKESDNGEVIGFAGLIAKPTQIPKEYSRIERLGPLVALKTGVYKTVDYVTLSFKMIWKMLKGEVGLHTLSGPITIAQGAGATAVVGFQYYLGFLALVSISLGVVNLLPIPVLDGGHLFYYLIEMIMQKPVSEKIQLIGFKIGIFILITLMSVAFYNDIIRLLAF